MKKNQIFTLAVILFLTACYSPTANLYQAEKTKGVDFKNYKTYAFLHTNDTAYTKLEDKQKVESALAAAVRQQLTKHGMVLDSANPDCLFTYTLVLNKTYQVGQSPSPVYAPQSNVGALPGQYDMYYYVPQSTAYYNPALYQGSMQVTTFRDGSLVIDMIDRKDKKIIWRSSAQGKVDERDRKGIRPTIDQIVPAMFKKFPVN
ncbi:MAG TPA: DUF4136 domain-containing protein [Chitinophagaceae bacterium]|jgi:hypothetical protein|nr:DUF4136 domain-containing protein [Chitinophagaceae bacterium]